MPENTKGCLICNGELRYTIEPSTYTCLLCGIKGETNATCENGHYVCDTCHSATALDLIERVTINTEEKDPVKIADTLMKDDRIKMHGPEHHFLVPAVLISAYYNQFGPAEKKSADIKTARKRAEEVKGGICGFWGTCGAGVGTGIFLSVLTKATPLSTREWRLSNKITGETLCNIAEAGGPRCCKRDTYIALGSAAEFLKVNLNLHLHHSNSIVCMHSERNRECLKENCHFFP